MATKLWEQEIDKTIDWGNADGLGTPVSGKYVQKFIKDSLAKKFGYLYFDRTALKYYVFADEDDYLTYMDDSINNAALLLATFDAPAPADINIISKSSDNVTTLLNAVNRKITFNYYIVDKSNNAVVESVSIRTSIEHSGELQTFTETWRPGANADDPNIGTNYEFNIDKYLKNEGTYTITITLTGLSTQASTTMTFFYTVVNLELSLSTFEYYKPFNTSVSEYKIPFSVTGAAGISKTVDILIDGLPLIQTGLGYNNVISSGDALTSNGVFQSEIVLYNKTFDGEIVKWPVDVSNIELAGRTIFTPGKHTLQMRVSIPGDSIDERFYSKTKYFEFVVIDDDITGKNETFLLYVIDAEAGTVFDRNAPIEITGQQYNSISLNVAVIDNGNRIVPVKYQITGRTTDYNETIDIPIQNQTIHTWSRIFNDADIYDIHIFIDPEFNTPSTDTIDVIATIESFSIAGEDIKESLPESLLVKYNAINRDNGELNKDVWTNSSTSNYARLHPYPAIFKNVLWNDLSGWNGEALVLKNGATVEFPIDLFNSDDQIGIWGNLGLTFEIDFETFDVQDDDAIILNFADPDINNRSYIKITATSATINSNNNVSLKTNFKENTRNKIAFSFNPTAEVEDGVSQGVGNPNLMLIYVNGVLDRAGKWGNGTANSDSIVWDAHTTKSIIIGNTEGAAGVKLYGIRIYPTALIPEEAFMNYVVDQGNRIPEIITKNHIYENGEISLDLVKAAIPTLVLYTDYSMANNAADKKEARTYNAQYFDPTDPSLNFYLRNGWLSAQGTSSMQYPIKNLRPYMNKVGGNTKPFSISTSEQAVRLARQGINVDSNFNTEFWPASEYSGNAENEKNVDAYVDSAGILPYSVNKKEIIKDSFFANAYHEIGKGLSKSYKTDLAIKYSAKTDIYFKNGTRDITKKGVTTTVDRFDIIVADDDKTVAQKITDIINESGSVYISAYRPLLRTGWEIGDNNYWKYLKELRWSGVTIYTRKANSNEDGGTGFDFSEAEKLDRNTEYYGLGAYWRQYDEETHYSGWTDRWTLKADYAESSMTHNGGIGRIWGNALRNFKYNGTPGLGMTNAQSKGLNADSDFIDIRTSCDCKPIVLFVKNPTGYNETTGKVEYGAAEFAGLFNIMTDKSSTPLFGFEDIKGVDNGTIFDSTEVQCWEFLQNGSLLATGNSLRFDTDEPAKYNDKGKLVSGEATYDTARMLKDGEKNIGMNIGEGRPIFTDFEPRWPECGADKKATEGDTRWAQDEVFGVSSSNFETFWNWVAFTKPAVKYEVSGGIGSNGEEVWLDGYELNPYVAFENATKAAEYRANTGKPVYLQWNNSGNIAYCKEGDYYRDGTTYVDDKGVTRNREIKYVFDPNIEGLPIYWLNESINYERVRKSVNEEKIGTIWGGDRGEVYKVGIYGFDALNHCRNNEGGLLEDEANKYLVDVYMKKQGNRYFYTNYYNITTQYNNSNGPVDPEGYELADDDVPYSQKTFMQYFSATKRDHLEVYKVAAYYIYIMRFGAADQVVKNCMMTTEDGQHWYFINYDNDTTLGVRNDAQLVFNWDFDRDTYDKSGNSYAYAGAKSVLWNNLSMDSDFMNIVKTVDEGMYSGGLLSIETVLEYLDEKQMNTWCERLYNKQEEIKYLSTFKNNFETDKFLLFMQGTRQSHRNWFVNHRWELFDAMWETGSYADKKIKFYEIVNDASNDSPRDLMKITSASKYYFTLQKNNNTVNNGFISLKAGETSTFDTKDNIAIGDPMVLIGPHKLKVLNFRPGKEYLSATLSLAETYEITKTDGVTKVKTNWIKEGGTMMTKLLIGNEDTIHMSPLIKINSMNLITSLEEIDIRTCQMLTESPSINSLGNLHRFRADNSSFTIFIPATGVVLYEVSLPSVNASKNNEIIVTDDLGNPVQAKDETGALIYDDQGKPVYQTEVVNNVLALQTLELHNAIFMHQPVSEYVSYQGEDDKLPYTETIDEETGEITLGGIYNNADAFRYTSESKAIFNVKPTIRLGSVIFDTVEGLDTKKFITDWRNTLLDAGESPTTRRVNLTNINWKDITVSELIELVKGFDADDKQIATFTFTNFTGTVNVVSNEIDPVTGKNAESITLPEYNRIIKYFGENVFTPGNSLVITTGSSIFYQPTLDTIVKEYTFTQSNFDVYAGPNVPAKSKTYEVIRGNTFKAKAVRFPNDGNTYKYILYGWGWNSAINRGVPLTVTQSGSTFTCLDSGIKLTTDNSGNAVFTAEDKGQYNNANGLFAIGSVKFNGDTSEAMEGWQYVPENTIYVRTVNRVIPSIINSYIDDEYKTNVSLTDENVHTLRFDLGEATNAPIESISISFNDPSYARNVIFDLNNCRIDGNTINLNGNKTVGRQLEIDFYASMPESTINAEITFEIFFETTQSVRSVSKVINAALSPIYPTIINVLDSHNDPLTDEPYEINRTGIHKFTVNLQSNTSEPFNIPIIDYERNVETHMGAEWSNYVKVSELTEVENGYTFTITVSTPGTFRSFTKADLITLNFYNKFDTLHEHPITKTIDIISSIIYPDNINLCVQDYLGLDTTQFVRTGSNRNVVDIYLVHNQGTYAENANESWKKLIDNSNDYIELRLIAEDTLVRDYISEANVYRKPTETYTINIEGDIVQSGDKTIDYTASNSGMITRYASGSYGVDSIKLKILAIPDFAATMTLSGKYRIQYDVDADPSTSNDINNLVDFTINIHYSVSSATSYQNLATNKYYVVDENSNYYEVPDVLNPDAQSTLSIANNKNITFIGYGYVEIRGNNKYPHFVYFRDRNSYSQYEGFFPASGTTMGANRDFYYTQQPTTAFAGYSNTETWINSRLILTGEWQTSGIKNMWTLYENNEKIDLYLPTFAEINGVIGNDKSIFIDKYDDVINYLRFLNSSKYGNLLCISDSIETFTSADVMQGTDTSISENDKVLWIVTSSTYDGASNSLYMGILWNMNNIDTSDDIIYQTLVGAISVAGSPRSRHLRVLPFIKVS